MANVNTCDLQCPVKALMGIEVQNTSAMGLVRLGFEGVRQMGYAATTCASRTESPATWEPSERCTDNALERAANLQPFQGQLTEWETTTLGRIGLGPDLLPVEG